MKRRRWEVLLFKARVEQSENGVNSIHAEFHKIGRRVICRKFELVMLSLP